MRSIIAQSLHGVAGRHRCVRRLGEMSMSNDVAEVLRQHEINPSAQRVAVAEYALANEDHPSADDVWTRVRKTFPHISRATVYNTLNLLVDKGLLKALALTEGRVVFDPKLAHHHHFIDEESGEISDIPWEDLKVARISKLEGVEVTDYQVVVRGRRL